MTSPTKRPRQLACLPTHFHNTSFSSMASGSDAGTFHSAHAHPSQMELRPMSQAGATRTVARPISPTLAAQSPILVSIRMERQDSGFSEGLPNSNRSSISSSRRSLESKRGTKRRTTNTSLTSSTRPSTKRASRSTPNAIARSSTSSGRRPSIQQRHTTPYHQPTHQFFQFPIFDDPQASSEQREEVVALPTPPPATVQYWTSDSTRRLEYAAIDAASRGVKGFFIKLIPDCILPPATRRTRFCEGDNTDDDLGSVRRYRLDLPEEKSPNSKNQTRERPGFWRGLSGGWGRSRRGGC